MDCCHFRRQCTRYKESAIRAEERLADALAELSDLRRRTPLPDGSSLELLLSMMKEKEAALHAARGDAQYAMSQAQDLKEDMAALINERDNALAREAEAVAMLSAFRSECSSELTGQEARMLQQILKVKEEVGADHPLSLFPPLSFSRSHASSIAPCFIPFSMQSRLYVSFKLHGIKDSSLLRRILSLFLLSRALSQVRLSGVAQVDGEWKEKMADARGEWEAELGRIQESCAKLSGELDQSRIEAQAHK